MTGNSLTGVDITISSSLTVSNMSLTVTDLQFIYESNTSTDFGGAYNGDFIIGIGGSVTFSTSAGDTTFAATFGSAASNLPGMVIYNGTLQNLYATVTSTISAQGLTLSVNSLQFQYVASGNFFQIGSGSVSISSGVIQFATASFVTVNGAPGLEIANGVLKALNIKVNSSLTVSGMTLTVTNLQFDYAAVSGQTFGNFEIAQGGSVSLSAGASNTLSFTGTFGTLSGGTATPGMVINHGVLQSFYIAISSNMSLGGLTLTTSNLTFAYYASSQTFEIPTGSVSITDSNGDFSFTGTFGTTTGATTNPGLVVDGNSAHGTYGSLTALNVTVTSQLVAAAVTFNVTNLNFVYDSSTNSYEIVTGSISFSTSEGYTFSATFGLPSPSNSTVVLPGLVIQNGSLTAFNASLTTSFTVAGLQIGVTNMAMNYSGNQFAMYGTVSVNTNNILFTGTIGNPSTSTYGLYIKNNTLASMAISITSTVNFGGLAMTATGLSFNYAAATSTSLSLFSLYGSVSISAAGVNLTGNLGTSALPGLTLVNGSLTELNLGVSANFTLFGLTCNIQNLTFQYYTSGSTQKYIMFGSLSVSVGQPGSTSSSSNQNITAMMGTQSNPGLILAVNGATTTVQQINMSISGSFNISGFGFTITNAGLNYTNTSGSTSYAIFGTFTLSNVFTATVQLGTGSTNPGIVIANGNFYLEAFAFSLDNVPIGAFTLNYLNISYTSAGNIWSGAAKVTFPTGFALGASMTFDNGVLADIGISYDAGSSSGIAIGDSGMFITEMSANLQNLNQPQNIIVSGTIEAVFGKKITIAGTTCSLFAATGSFSADSQQLVIQGNYYQGAYNSNGKWQGILGTGSASVDINWAAGVYSASISESLYGGVFKISAQLAFDNSGDIGIIATASVNVPNGVPFIGGTNLGSMGFAFIYTASSNVGTVAAWASVNLGFTKVTTGFQYQFDTKNSQDGGLVIIGASQVSSLKSEVNSIASANASTPPIYTYTYNVVIPSTVTGEYGLNVQASWPSNSGTQQLLISGPNDTSGGTLNYYSATATSLSSASVPSTDYYSFQTINGTSQAATVVGLATTSNGSTTASNTVPLTPGTYTFQVMSSYQFTSSSDINWSQQIYYTAPSVAITTVPSQALSFVPSMTGFAASQLQANTTITLYADANSSGYQGKKVGSFSYQANASGQLTNVPYIDLSAFSPGVPIYVYAMINDGTNTPVYSVYSTPVVAEPDIVGQVIDQFGNPLAGLTVFLDLNGNGVFDTANGSTIASTEPTMVTNAMGYYYFSGLEAYSSTDLGYPSFLVDVQMPTPSYAPITPAAVTSSNASNPVVSSNRVSISVNATTNNPTNSQVANFSVSRLASISGSIYRDIPQTGVYVSTDPSLGGATVYIDSTGSGTYTSGDPTCITGPSGLYSFYGLAVPDVGNNSFESPTLAANSFQAQPTGTGADWTFSSGAGIATNGSSLTSSNGNAPQGSQVGYLQDAATISQPISGFQTGTAYYITVSAATEAGLAASMFTVSWNGNVIGTFSPTVGYQTFTTSVFNPGAGATTITFTGVNASGAAETTFLDNVQILPVTQYTVGILNSTASKTPQINGTDQYVVTFPIAGSSSSAPSGAASGASGTSAGTWTVPVPSDAPQFTNVNFGAISLASVSGTVSSTTTSSANPQSGTVINLATPITTVSSPNYQNFSTTNGLTLNRSSAGSNNSLKLFATTQSATKTSSWYNTAQPVTGGFTTTFQYSMNEASATAAGFAFVLQNNPNTTATLGNTSFGYGQMADSLAIIFDATNNELLLEYGGNTSTTTPIQALSSGELGFSLANGSVYTVIITYVPSSTAGIGTLSVYLNANGSTGATPALSAVVNLASYLNLGTSTNAYCGFTAGTSTSSSTVSAPLEVSLYSWSFTPEMTTSVTTNASGNYSFTGLFPGTTYSVTQVVPTGQVQSSPLNNVGIYSEQTLTTLSKIASSVTGGDFNGDGIPDVAYALSLKSNSAFQIAYAYGNGSGGFGTPVIVTIPVQTSLQPQLAMPSTFSEFDAHIVAGHFVNTGSTSRDDIAYVATMANGGNAVVIYDIYTGAVVNAIEVETAVNPLGATAASQGSPSTINNVVVGDLNNQGYDDIVTSTYGGVWTLSLQNLAPSTSWVVNPSSIQTPISTPSLQSGAVGYNAGVAIADFNGDGNPDLVTVGVQYVPGEQYVNGSYSFTWTSLSVVTTYQVYYGNGSGVTYSISGVYNTDTGTTTTTTTQQIFQNFATTSTYLSTGSAAPLYPLPIGITAADASGDGLPDIALAAYSASLQPNVFLLTQSAPDTFVVANEIPIPGGHNFNFLASAGSNATTIPSSSYFPSQISSIDLNSDGFTDIAVIDPNVGQLFLLTTSAAPLTSSDNAQTIVFPNGSIAQFAVADFANNGYPSFVVASPTSGVPVQVLNGTLNVGYYTFTPADGAVITGENFNDIAFNDIAFAPTASASSFKAASINESAPVSAAAASPNLWPDSVPMLVGRVFTDINLNGRSSSNDPGLANARVYLDLANTGLFDPSVDPSTLTNAEGWYSFSGLVIGQSYTIRVVPPLGMAEPAPQHVTLKAHSSMTIVQRDLGLSVLWTNPQSTFRIDPLGTATINVAAIASLQAYGVEPVYKLVGQIPAGMTINAKSGVITWTPPASLQGTKTDVQVEVVNLKSPTLKSTKQTIQIYVNSITSENAFVRAVYGNLLSRLPSAAELAASKSQLQTISESDFVSAILHSTEYATGIVKAAYSLVLSRVPSAGELAIGVAALAQGGSSEQLVLNLLTSPEFIKQHSGNLAYVNGVNQILIPVGVSSATTSREVLSLKLGTSRTKLVQSIQRSQAASEATVKKLSLHALSVAPNQSDLTRWVGELMKGKLNTQSLTLQILTSKAFRKNSATSPISNLAAVTPGKSESYDHLAALNNTLSGQLASRPQIDSLAKQVAAGKTSAAINADVYKSPPAAAYRIQSVFQNLLRRSATPVELQGIQKSVQSNNLTEGTKIKLLASPEFRRRFANTTDYVIAVYQTLTRTQPSSSQVQSALRMLKQRGSEARFVASVASSYAGKVGQINQQYADILRRDATPQEVQSWLKSSLNDQTIALSLLDSSEFRSKQIHTPEL